MSTTRKAPIEILLSPFTRFFHTSASSGVLLLVCTLVAMVWANSPWAAQYEHFRETSLSVGFGDHMLSLPLSHWVNDGLMAIFFFVVGLEIKRELLVGELSTTRKALLPIVAATGGMLAPAALYLFLTPAAVCWRLGHPHRHGYRLRAGHFVHFGRPRSRQLKDFSDRSRHCRRHGRGAHHRAVLHL